VPIYLLCKLVSISDEQIPNEILRSNLESFKAKSKAFSPLKYFVYYNVHCIFKSINHCQSAIRKRFNVMLVGV